MADEARTSTTIVELTQRLQEEPFKFHFLQALRRLECAFAEKPRFGHSLRATDDPIRFTQEPTVAFAPRTVASFEPARNGVPPRLAVFFFGSFGPNGPLPLHLTQFARDRMRNESDDTFRRFLDVFHHRMLGLFYRTWADAQPTVQFDRPEEDRFAAYVGALFGLGMPSLLERDALPDLARFHHAGLFAGLTRHADGLRTILQSFFTVPVDVEEFVGQWLDVPHDYRCRLGESPDTGTLGRTVVVGSRVWDCQQKFRVVFGPMGFEDYQRLLPETESIQRLVSGVFSYIGHELSWDVKLVLKKEEVPPLELGTIGQLGWTTWLTSRPMEKDADQLIFDPLASQG